MVGIFVDKKVNTVYNTVMKLSTRAKYGLRLCFLMGLSNDTVSLTQLVKQTNLSAKYLENILLKLRRGGIVSAERGASGGYRLNKPANEISVNDVLVCLDDGFEFSECVTDSCHDEYCPNKRVFKRVYSEINAILKATTVDDMINDYKCVKK